MSQEGEIMTAAEVASLARVSRQTVYNWAENGRLEPVMKLPNGALRFRRSDVEALLRPDPIEAAAS